jgi:hypothetical protein
MNDNKTIKKTKGGCLCGSVRFEIEGRLRDIINCHCSKCRKFHGHFGAYTRVKESNLKLLKKDSIKWFRSTTDETDNVHRGFCSQCGSSLFWHPKGKGFISVAAGALDEPTQLETMGHIWTSQKSDYYTINDHLPSHTERWPG